MSDLNLETFGLSETRGFLCQFEADSVDLPEMLQPLRNAAMALPYTLPTGRIRNLLAGLPATDIKPWIAEADDAQLRTALVHASFLAQAYVWGEPDAPQSLPRSIAEPLWHLSQVLDYPPLLSYSGYVLDNWARIDPDGPIDLSNTRMLQPFLGGMDEAWFVLIHVAIEARAGSMLQTIPTALAAIKNDHTAAVEAALDTMIEVWTDLNAIFDRMPERCDPYIYFHRVRPWIHGWKDNPALVGGLIYEGVTDTNGQPMAYRGQTGSQSSIVPCMDAFLGIGHAADPLRTYLDELHVYRPPGHRRFIETVRERSSLRDYVSGGDSVTCREAYNECINQVTAFRTQHLKYAASYINKQSRGSAGNSADVGTGGTPFMKYLKKHRDEAQAHLLS